MKILKQQNFEFHKHLCKLLEKDNKESFDGFETWVLQIAQDGQHLQTPTHFVLREFLRTQDQYLDYINEFALLHKDKYDQEKINSWNRLLIKIIGKVMTWFVEENHKYAQFQLRSQQEMIYELSSPVIALKNNEALLPLVGDIDTTRAKLILEKTLEQCSNKGVERLYIDLSGVVLIDTMVAHQLFQLIDALSLIGVKTTLSGIRPEIAATAVQLGIPFNKITIKSNLSQALESSR